MSRMARHAEPEVEWKPRTTLGMMVSSGKIKTMEEIFENGLRIQVRVKREEIQWCFGRLAVRGGPFVIRQRAEELKTKLKPTTQHKRALSRYPRGGKS
jgi:hypothetical protein